MTAKDSAAMSALTEKLRAANEAEAMRRDGEEKVGHTPGPWEAREWAEDCPFPAGVPIAVHRAGDPSRGARICEMVGQGEPGSVLYSSEVTAANARLIAAAPELLAALRTLREAATNAYKIGRVDPLAFVTAGNVIAKATGR